MIRSNLTNKSGVGRDLGKPCHQIEIFLNLNPSANYNNSNPEPAGTSISNPCTDSGQKATLWRVIYGQSIENYLIIG